MSGGGHVYSLVPSERAGPLVRTTRPQSNTGDQNRNGGFLCSAGAPGPPDNFNKRQFNASTASEDQPVVVLVVLVVLAGSSQTRQRTPTRTSVAGCLVYCINPNWKLCRLPGLSRSSLIQWNQFILWISSSRPLSLAVRRASALPQTAGLASFWGAFPGREVCGKMFTTWELLATFRGGNRTNWAFVAGPQRRSDPPDP